MSKMYTNGYRIVQCVCWSFRFFSVYISVACSGSVPPLASAVRSDCVRRPVSLRPPPNQIASAIQSVRVRRPIRLRSVNDAKISTATALTLRLLFANTQLLLSKRKWKSRKTLGFIWSIRRNNLYLRSLSYITPLTLDWRKTNNLKTKESIIN